MYHINLLDRYTILGQTHNMTQSYGKAKYAFSGSAPFCKTALAREIGEYHSIVFQELLKKIVRSLVRSERSNPPRRFI